MNRADEEFEKLKKIEALNYEHINIPKGATNRDMLTALEADKPESEDKE